MPIGAWHFSSFVFMTNHMREAFDSNQQDSFHKSFGLRDGDVKGLECGYKELMNGVVNLDLRMSGGKVRQPGC